MTALPVMNHPIIKSPQADVKDREAVSDQVRTAMELGSRAHACVRPWAQSLTAGKREKKAEWEG